MGTKDGWPRYFGGRGAVGGEEDDAVCAEGVEGVGDFGEGGGGGSLERSGTQAKKPKRLGWEARRLKQ